MAPAVRLGQFPKKVLIVDDDLSIAQYAEQLLREKEIAQVDLFDDSEKAWERMLRSLEGPYDFVITDWKMPSLSGVALLNRIKRHKTYHRIPVLVSSGFLSKKDFSLLEEFPLTGLIEKPLQKQVLLRKVELLHKDSMWFREKEIRITSLFQKLKNKKEAHQAFLQLRSFISEITYSAVPLTLMASRVLMQEGLLSEAEELLSGMLLKEGNSPALLNELAKIKIAKKSFPEAKALLSRAQMNSPDNLERLLMLGETSLEEMNPTEAEHHFQKALALDYQNEEAKSGKDLSQSLTMYSKDVSSIGLAASFASALNALGIAMIHSGDFAKGMAHYEKALQYLKDPELKAKLSFNLGLGYLRWRKPKEAAEWFLRSMTESPTFTRSSELLEKLKVRRQTPGPQTAAPRTSPAAVSPAASLPAQQGIPVAPVSGLTSLPQVPITPSTPVASGPAFAPLIGENPKKSAPASPTFSLAPISSEEEQALLSSIFSEDFGDDTFGSDLLEGPAPTKAAGGDKKASVGKKKSKTSAPKDDTFDDEMLNNHKGAA